MMDRLSHLPVTATVTAATALKNDGIDIPQNQDNQSSIIYDWYYTKSY